MLTQATCARPTGPTITSISSLIVPYLKTYLQMLEYETSTEPHPYLFGPSNDLSRAMTTSQWSQHAKGIVKRWTGVAAPPKTMRASFITYMKDHTECPKILAAAARAMKHKGETQGARSRSLSPRALSLNTALSRLRF